MKKKVKDLTDEDFKNICHSYFDPDEKHEKWENVLSKTYDIDGCSKCPLLVQEKRMCWRLAFRDKKNPIWEKEVEI